MKVREGSLSSNRQNFVDKLIELAARFESDSVDMRRRSYDEATLRLEYLDPMFSALGWNVWNSPVQPLHLRDVIVENRTDMRDGPGKVDYVFRTNGLERWICEAKRPFDSVNRHYFQIQNYTYSMRLWLGVLSDFEHFIVFVVGARPSKEHPFSPVPGWRIHYTQYETFAGRIWDLLSKEAVESGSIEKFIQGLGKVRTTARQGWLIKPDRTKTVDVVFLKFLEDQRVALARDIVKRNPHISWQGPLLADCLQVIFDRLLFQRVSEDRNIDIGTPLSKSLENWEARGKIAGQLWPALIANFKHLSATFNGGIYGSNPREPHLIDTLKVSDSLLADFIEEIAGDSSEWLFGTMPLWLLGSVYERFLGSEVDASGNVEKKAHARKAGGVYYTPEPVVREVVNLTIGPLLQGRSPKDVQKLKIIDPSCGSGSFLLAVYNRILQHCLDWFAAHPDDRNPKDVFENGGTFYLTTAFKRRLLKACIFGVDVDRVAVQVAQMSLCLRVLEDETQEALTKEKTLFPKETFLPDLDENIVHANSLIPVTAFPEYFDVKYLASCNAVDWSILRSKTQSKRGFDAVVGNPPWGADLDDTASDYLRQAHRATLVRMPDTYIYFTHLAIEVLLRREGIMGLVLPGTLLNQADAAALRRYLLVNGVEAIADLGQGVFQGALNTTCIVVARKGGSATNTVKTCDAKNVAPEFRDSMTLNWQEVDREVWEETVKSDPAATFFSSNLDHAKALSAARTSIGRLADLIDEFGIQRGVTPDVAEGHILTPQQAKAAKIEPEVLRGTLRGEDLKAFMPATANMRLIYTTSHMDAKKIPNAIKYLAKFKEKITCKEVAAGKHEWWRLHRPRDPAIFNRPKIIGLTTTRNIELVWDPSSQLVVTDAMYVFAPKEGIPPEFLMGLMHSRPFADFYHLANQGDGRVIPQIKAAKLLEVPIPMWNATDPRHRDVVSTVMALLSLANSDSAGASRAFAAQRKRLEQLAAAIYGLELSALEEQTETETESTGHIGK